MPSESIALSESAQHNGLASMLFALLRENIATRPEKSKALAQLRGKVAIVAEDAKVSLTLQFDLHGLVIHDGIQGIPDVTIRAQSDDITKLSLMKFTPVLGLPKLWDPTTRRVVASLLKRRIRVYADPLHAPMLSHLSHLMAVD
ncbi:MAG: hypothetical protein H6714_03590 [Myxococcales bacterium]|nr:hypothetical protein [Myxococcales bacterium]